MGLMVDGQPLSWEETKLLSEHIRKQGAIQFANCYSQSKDICSDGLKWGDEVEYFLLKTNNLTRRVTVCGRGTNILKQIIQKRRDEPESWDIGEWQPEAAETQLESIPAEPYSGLVGDLPNVEANMRRRREELESFLGPDESVATICAFPRTIIANAKSRAQDTISISAPVFLDKYTQLSGYNGEKKRQTSGMVSFNRASPLLVHSSLHVTFQCQDLYDARIIFDNFMVLAPIMLALSAACPFYCGYLTDHDTRWEIFSQHFDDRTRAEKGLQGSHNMALPSRRGTPLSYLSTEQHSHHDVAVPINQDTYNYLIENGVDNSMAMHVAHMFTRDALIAYKQRLNQDNEQSTEHYENILTCHWHTARLRIPSYADASLGWRVEFRPCEIQLTEYENAAFCTFNLLVTRIGRAFNLDLKIPISKLTSNMKTAILNDAACMSKFYFRQTDNADAASLKPEDDVALMSINSIINGSEGVTEGLVPMMRRYLDTIEITDISRHVIEGHLNLISKKASGELLTTAQWQRKFVVNHPSYQHDSIVSDDIIYDLMTEIAEITQGNKRCNDLVRDY